MKKLVSPYILKVSLLKGNSVPPNSNDLSRNNNLESLKDKAYSILLDKSLSLVSCLIDKLFDSGLLWHYFAHFKELSSGRLALKYMAVLFVFERAYWQTLKSTTNMTYDAITKTGMPFGRNYSALLCEICAAVKKTLDKLHVKTQQMGNVALAGAK